MDGSAPGDDLRPQHPVGPAPWTPRGARAADTPVAPVKERIRWRTGWWLLSGSLVCSACMFTLVWFDLRSAQAFARSAHPVVAEVVRSDCWVLCKGGPRIEVAYDGPEGNRVVKRLHGYERRYRVGDTVEVVYSDDSGSMGRVALPRAEERYRRAALHWSVAGGAGLLLAVLAWAFPANLRRLDRRDARRSGPEQTV